MYIRKYILVDTSDEYLHMGVCKGVCDAVRIDKPTLKMGRFLQAHYNCYRHFNQIAQTSDIANYCVKLWQRLQTMPFYRSFAFKTDLAKRQFTFLKGVIDSPIIKKIIRIFKCGSFAKLPLSIIAKYIEEISTIQERAQLFPKAHIGSVTSKIYDAHKLNDFRPTKFAPASQLYKTLIHHPQCLKGHVILHLAPKAKQSIKDEASHGIFITSDYPPTFLDANNVDPSTLIPKKMSFSSIEKMLSFLQIYVYLHYPDLAFFRLQIYSS